LAIVAGGGVCIGEEFAAVERTVTSGDAFAVAHDQFWAS